MYQTTKVLSGFSTCFRQHSAQSHCSKLHGYALEFKVTLSCHVLNKQNWCFDFGEFKKFKDYLTVIFDHTTVVAADDPKLEAFRLLQEKDIIRLIVLPAVGCEAFAKFVHDKLEAFIEEREGLRVAVVSVECIENKTNSAIYLK